MRAKWEALAKVNFHTPAPSGEQRLSIPASQGCHFVTSRLIQYGIIAKCSLEENKNLEHVPEIPTAEQYHPQLLWSALLSV